MNESVRKILRFQQSVCIINNVNTVWPVTEIRSRFGYVGVELFGLYFVLFLDSGL